MADDRRLEAVILVRINDMAPGHEACVGQRTIVLPIETTETTIHGLVREALDQAPPGDDPGWSEWGL